MPRLNPGWSARIRASCQLVCPELRLSSVSSSLVGSGKAGVPTSEGVPTHHSMCLQLKASEGFQPNLQPNIGPGKATTHLSVG